MQYSLQECSFSYDLRPLGFKQVDTHGFLMLCFGQCSETQQKTLNYWFEWLDFRKKSKKKMLNV